MKKLNIVLFMAIAFCMQWGYAQQVLKGKVTDQDDYPIEEAYIYVPNTNKHAHTSEDGMFILENVKEGETVEIGHLGYKKYSVVIKNLKEELNVKLQEEVLDLAEVVIPKKVNALKVFADINVQVNPVVTSQDILRQVPGLIIGQHAGGGKAEQIFLRGFDIDHGTDIKITVEGMPGNMVSHAHGQGYTDLHFVIPETVEKVEFDKGPYTASKGNFATAGYVNFKLKEKVNKSQVKVGVGNLNTQRLTGLFNLYNKNGTSAFVAGEYSLMDGPYDTPQNFSRVNLLGRFTKYFDNGDKLGVLVSHFTSNWDASGQIPEDYATNDKLEVTNYNTLKLSKFEKDNKTFYKWTGEGKKLHWFGAIDDEEGGYTYRTNVMVDYDKRINESSFVRNKLFYNRYGLEIYSDFTFYLDHPTGDQFRQNENRQIFGAMSEYNKNFYINDDYRINLQVGVDVRNDQAKDTELTWTHHRNNYKGNRVDEYIKIEDGDDVYFVMEKGLKRNTKGEIVEANALLNNEPFKLKVNDGKLEIEKGTMPTDKTLATENVDSRIKLGNIDETNVGAYVNAEFKYKKWIFNPGVRFDGFKFQYKDKLIRTEGDDGQTVPDYRTDVAHAFTVSPKFNLIYNANDKLQLFLKTGKGFHSNDTRVNVVKPEGRVSTILPSAYGADLGFIWKPAPKLMLTTALWYLYLGEELVYVGDAGVQEASYKTYRKGIDFSAVYHPVSWLNLNLDATFTDPKGEDEKGNLEPVGLAPTFTLQAGATVNHPSGFFGGIKVLHLGDRPTGESDLNDNPITAVGYTVTSLNLGYTWKDLTLGVQIRNLFDTKWRETQFGTTSRPVLGGPITSSRHLTPGLPFNYKFTLTYRF